MKDFPKFLHISNQTGYLGMNYVNDEFIEIMVLNHTIIHEFLFIFIKQS